MDVVTIERAIAEKQVCESCIKQALERFQRETGLAVHDVVLGFVDYHQNDRQLPERIVSVVHLDVRL